MKLILAILMMMIMMNGFHMESLHIVRNNKQSQSLFQVYTSSSHEVFSSNFTLSLSSSKFVLYFMTMDKELENV